MAVEEFPHIDPEPTSDVEPIAKNDEFAYSVISCPECGGRAFEGPELGGVSEFACRNCRLNPRLLQKKANYGTEWGRVREWVIERDGGECQECESSSELHVHHIEKLVWFETTAEANQPENLITLCSECHREFENNPDHFDTI